jgi:transcriptional regulator with XRE-family HTH domain
MMIRLLEELRTDAKLSKSKLAKLAGIHPNTYSNYVKGGKIDLDTFNNILKALDYKLIIAKMVIE